MERRYELKANEPVSEQCERASGFATDMLLSERSEVSDRSGVCCIILKNRNAGFKNC